jgi:hypothetical protein
MKVRPGPGGGDSSGKCEYSLLQNAHLSYEQLYPGLEPPVGSCHCTRMLPWRCSVQDVIEAWIELLDQLHTLAVLSTGKGTSYLLDTRLCLPYIRYGRGDKRKTPLSRGIQSLLYYVPSSLFTSCTAHYQLKLKLSHYTPWRRLGERRYSSYSFSTSALDGGEWSASCCGRALTSGKGRRYPLDRRLGGPQSRSWHRG